MKNPICTPKLRLRFGLFDSTRLVASLFVFASLCGAPAQAQTQQPAPNAVTYWNSVASEAFTPTQGLDPLRQSRTYAILHAAIHDALNAIEPRYERYTVGAAASPAASVDAAIATAARNVLTTLVPAQSVAVNAAYASALAAIPEGPAKASGIAVGQSAAEENLRRRQQDGLDTVEQPIYVPRPGLPGEYQFTAPFDFANLPGWGRVTPFAIQLKDHALEGPLVLNGRQYARDFEYVKEIGRIDSKIRTAEQSEIAQFWYEDSPLGWNRIANTVIQQKGLDPWQSARAFALVNFAMADAFIAGFAAKYEFRFWRPVTAIREAANDGNSRTEADATWEPFLITPPVPDYPSTHTVVGAAAAEVLIDLFGDRVRYTTTSLTLPGVTRSFRGFSEAAEENGQSRIFAGIHFRHAVRDGHQQGRSIGRAVERLLPSTGKGPLSF
jgi:hypothetical protein